MSDRDLTRMTIEAVRPGDRLNCGIRVEIRNNFHPKLVTPHFMTRDEALAHSELLRKAAMELLPESGVTK